MSAPRDPVVVVGAGPYGLAVAAALRSRGVPFRIFGEPMGSWRHNMPPGMLLKSELPASSIGSAAGPHSLGAFYQRSGRAPVYPEPVALQDFYEYGRWYADELVGEVEKPRVSRVLRRNGGGFELHLSTGVRLEAPAVILAVGHVDFTHLPQELGQLPASLVSHSSAYGDLGQLSGKRVAVLGAGQSALETAVLLAEAGASATLLARRSSLLWNPLPPGLDRPMRTRLRQPGSALGPGWRTLFYSQLPQVFWRLPGSTRLRLVGEALGPAGAWWLRERFERQVPVRIGRTLERADPADGVLRLRMRSAEGEREELEVDHLLAATGYRVDLGHLGILDPDLFASVVRLGGSPVLDRNFQSSVAGLFFVGLAAAPSFGPVMRFVYGSGFAARRVADALGGRARAGRSAPSES